MKREPEALYIDAKKRVMKAIRSGNFQEADRWTTIAERIHRMDFRLSASRLNHQKHRLAEQKHAEQMKAKQPPPSPHRPYRYPQV